jgi:hypothetical protein
LGDLEVLFTNNYGLESTIIRLQSCLQLYHSRSILMEIFPELKLVSLIGLAEGCCSIQETHKLSSTFCYKDKRDDIGPVLFLIPGEHNVTDPNFLLNSRCIRLYTSADTCPGSTARPYEAPVFLAEDLVFIPQGRMQIRLCRVLEITGTTAVTQTCSSTGPVDNLSHQTRTPLASLKPPSSKAALRAASRLTADHLAHHIPYAIVFAC